MAGELITAPYQFEYNAQLFGSGEIRVVSLDPFEYPDVRLTRQARPTSHGEMILGRRLGPKTFTAEILVVADSQELLDSKVSLIHDAVGEQLDLSSGTKGDALLAFRLPWWDGQTSDGNLYIWCQPQRLVDIAEVGNDDSYIKRLLIEFYAADPHVYSAVKSATVTHSTNTNGWSYARTYDWAYGGANPSNTVNCPNAGNAGTWPTFTVDGPFTAVTIERNPGSFYDASTMTLNADIAAGESVIIDTRQRKVWFKPLVGSVVSRYYWLEDPSSWFGLEPDPSVNTLKLTANGSDVSTALTVSWRDAWV